MNTFGTLWLVLMRVRKLRRICMYIRKKKDLEQVLLVISVLRGGHSVVLSSPEGGFPLSAPRAS